ncbi:hypothetical protein [Hippea alviniae]|uniref:hypothetical protein n=1 Tax=Hippea alviniae TaxID=1279027 RepID=UPI0003B32291|nr:hypothetical protein [Hippea alviniae]
MRKFIGLLIFVLVLTFTYGCNSKTERHTLKKSVIKNYGILVGLVEVYGKDVYIVSNYTSRSRVSYYVEGRLKNDIARLNGKVVEVKGETQRIGWSGTIKVEKIIRVIGSAEEKDFIYKGIQPKGR